MVLPYSFGMDVVAHLKAEDHASAVLHIEKGLVQTGFRGKRDVLVQRLNQFETATRTVVAIGMAPQVADVAFQIGIAPDADQRVHAGLIDDARVGLGERLRPELYVD